MSVDSAIESANRRLNEMGIKVEPGVTIVFKTPDGLLIISHDEVESRLTVEVVFGGEVIELTERLEEES